MQIAAALQRTIEEFSAFKIRIRELGDNRSIDQAYTTFKQDRLDIFNKLSGLLSDPEIYAMNMPTTSGVPTYYAGHPRRSTMLNIIDSCMDNARETLLKYT